MRIVVVVNVAIIVDAPDDDAGVVALRKGPLDELAERLRQETRHGRDYTRPNFTSPDVPAWNTGGRCSCPAGT
jgi:hypothetical protein